MKRFLITPLVIIVSITLFTFPAHALTYYLWDDFGGTWYDAEKSLTNTEDDDMCWAAAASNILMWSGWRAGFSNEDSMFSYFQDHWLDVGGFTSVGWEWWFDGIDRNDVDVSGGGFYKTYTFSDYYLGYAADTDAVPKIAEFLKKGYGVSIGIRPPSATGGHAITTWGYEYDKTGILGLYVTDSDDNKNDANPPDALRYYDVYSSEGLYYLDDFSGGDWWIDDVWALRAIPEPKSILLFLAGIAGLMALCWKKNKRMSQGMP